MQPPGSAGGKGYFKSAVRVDGAAGQKGIVVQLALFQGHCPAGNHHAVGGNYPAGDIGLLGRWLRDKQGPWNDDAGNR